MLGSSLSKVRTADHSINKNLSTSKLVVELDVLTKQNVAVVALVVPCHSSLVEVWRLLAAKRIVVAFRGTSDFGDVLVDIAAASLDLVSKACRGLLTCPGLEAAR